MAIVALVNGFGFLFGPLKFGGIKPEDDPKFLLIIIL